MLSPSLPDGDFLFLTYQIPFPHQPGWHVSDP